MSKKVCFNAVSKTEGDLISLLTPPPPTSHCFPFAAVMAGRSRWGEKKGSATIQSQMRVYIMRLSKKTP